VADRGQFGSDGALAEVTITDSTIWEPKSSTARSTPQPRNHRLRERRAGGDGDGAIANGEKFTALLLVWNFGSGRHAGSPPGCARWTEAPS
jgi:hypothetical protein